MNTEAVLRNTALGAASGVVAALAMNAFQSGWSAISARLQPEDGRSGGGTDEEPSTEKAADRISEAATGKPVAKEDKTLAGEAVHYGFGALLGGLYGGTATAFPQVRTGLGAPFGAAAWAVADETLVPAAGLSKPAWEAPASTHLYALASHLVFGVVLDATQTALQRGLATVGDGKQRQRA